MSKLSNQPTFVKPKEEDLPLIPLTYESLANNAKIKPGSIGKSLVSVNLETHWDEALKLTQEPRMLATIMP